MYGYDYYEWQVVEESGDFVYGSLGRTRYEAERSAFDYLAENFRPGRRFFVEGRMHQRAPGKRRR